MSKWIETKLKKCSFLQTEVNCLGFIIDEDGMKPNQEKVEAIRAFPAPACVNEVCSFVGMCSYYHRFIPNFSHITEPIIDLTRKCAHFKWTDINQTASQFIKDSLTTVPLLAYPDSNKPYTLYTDASDTCKDACLTQLVIRGETNLLFVS